MGGGKLKKLNLSEDSPPINSLNPHPVDVDRWELVISPEEYQRRFKDTLSTVQLISRAPLRRLHTTYHRGPGFDRWMLLAQANHQLWVDPRFKDPFFARLDQYQIAQPGQHPLQASQGNVHLSTSVFVRCLREAGCDTIRLKAYGPKTPIDGGFVRQEPAEVDHRWAIHNFIMSGTSAVALDRNTYGCLYGMDRRPTTWDGTSSYAGTGIWEFWNGQHQDNPSQPAFRF